MATVRNPQVVIPVTPVLADNSDASQVRWIRAMSAAYDDLVDTLTNVITNQTRNINNLEVVTEHTTDYTSVGQYPHEIIICNNTMGTDITITLQTLTPNDRITVVRAGKGKVTVDGAGSTIIGETTQVIPAQYDAADLVASETEWVLK